MPSWIEEHLFPNVGRRERADQQRDEAMENLEGLGPQYEERYEYYIDLINDYLENNPEIDLTGFQDILAGLSEDLGRIRRDTERGVGRYLREGEEYTDAMLEEIETSTGDYLTGYKRLARDEMPGLNIYRDQITGNLSSNLQALKSFGGGSQNALVNLLQGNQNQLTSLALEAGRYKTQTQRDLANAYLTAGSARGEAQGRAAQFSQNAAGIRTNLGQFSAGVSGQQANITGQQASLENIMFQNNEMIPWMAGLNWAQAQAQSFDPLAFYGDLYGSQVGFYEGESDEARDERMANWQMFMDIIGMYMQVGADATQGLATGGTG